MIKIGIIILTIILRINLINNPSFENLKFYNNYLYIEELDPWRKYIKKDFKNKSYKREGKKWKKLK